MAGETKSKVIPYRGALGNSQSQITQAQLQQHLELASRYKVAKRDYEESRRSLVEALRAGLPIEPGFLAAELRVIKREALVVGS